MASALDVERQAGYAEYLDSTETKVAHLQGYVGAGTKLEHVPHLTDHVFKGHHLVAQGLHPMDLHRPAPKLFQ